MTFREAFLYACDRNPKATAGNKRLLNRVARADCRDRKVRPLWNRMQRRVATRYKKDTGRTVTDFGDGQFLDWLVENLPAILQLLMSFLTIFAVL